jgi:hypothetical protein
MAGSGMIELRGLLFGGGEGPGRANAVHSSLGGEAMVVGATLAVDENLPNPFDAPHPHPKTGVCR